MVVLGEKRVDFVVVQFANGVSEDDGQEVELEGQGVEVVVEMGRKGRGEKARL